MAATREETSCVVFCEAWVEETELNKMAEAKQYANEILDLQGTQVQSVR